MKNPTHEAIGFDRSHPSRVVAIDIETTGLVPMYDYITQIALVVMDGEEVIGEPFRMDCRPDLERMKFSPAAVKSRVSDWTELGQWIKKLEESPPMPEVAKELARWCAANDCPSYPVVAYNAPFDWSFFDQRVLCFRSVFQCSPLSSMWIDVLGLARSAMPYESKYNLDMACLALGIETKRQGHDALQDAILCGRVFARLQRLEVAA